MEAWSKRVIREKIELDKKIVKLEKFVIANKTLKSFRLLTQQLAVMKEYSNILGQRISEFNNG